MAEEGFLGSVTSLGLGVRSTDLQGWNPRCVSLGKCLNLSELLTL